MMERNRMCWSAAFLVIGIIVLVACSPLPDNIVGKQTEGAQAQAANLPLVKGKQVQTFYLDSCSGCHSPDRRGATGPALLPQRLTEKDEYYFDVIKNGKPNTIMPPWGGQLSDEEIRTLIAFIKSEAAASASEWGEKDIWGSLTVINDEKFSAPIKPVKASESG